MVVVKDTFVWCSFLGCTFPLLINKLSCFLWFCTITNFFHYSEDFSFCRYVDNADGGEVNLNRQMQFSIDLHALEHFDLADQRIDHLLVDFFDLRKLSNRFQKGFEIRR